MAKISVIVPCFNQELYIKECLESVLAQTFKDYEIIVINDGSTDNSLAVIQEYQNNYPDKIKVINQENQGVVIARNKAIEQASGEYIFPLDGDDKITPDCLEKLYEAMLNNKGDIITCRVQYFDKKTEEMILPQPNKQNMNKDNCLVNAALLRKIDFIKAGGYDQKFGIALEDYDLWCNLLYRHNKKIYRVDEILFFYRMKDYAESRNFQHRSEHEKLVELIYKKYPAMTYYKYLYKFFHFFIGYKIKGEKKYIKILGISFRIK